MVIWDKQERSSIEYRWTKTKLITTVNQKKGEYIEEPMRTESKNNQTAKSAG